MDRDDADFDGLTAFDEAEGQEYGVDRRSRSAPGFDLSELKVGASDLFSQLIETTRMSVSISDPNLDDCPLVYVNPAFTDVTGYSFDEAVGRNCRFLQGRETDPEAVARMREAIASRADTIVELLNYRKDGTQFWNAVQISPIYDSDGEVAYLCGSQWDVSRLVAERENVAQQHRIAGELRHRTDNIFAVVSALTRLSSRNATDPRQLADRLTERFSALAIAHRVSIDAESRSKGDSDLQTLVEEVILPYRTEDCDRFAISGDPVDLGRRLVTPVGLAIHELCTNALKYGALSESDGRVEIIWTRAEDGLQLSWTERDGPSVAAPDASNAEPGHGNGSRIMTGILAGIGGSIEFDYSPGGLQAQITLPL